MSNTANIGVESASLEATRQKLKSTTFSSVREVLSDKEIEAACRQAKYMFRNRLISPTVTILHMVLAAIWPEDSLAASRDAFITVNLSAMDATMPNVNDEFAKCRSLWRKT